MKLGHIELAVPQPREAAAFYCDVLGFSLVADQGDGFGWVAKDGVEFLLRRPGDGPLPCIVLYSDDPHGERLDGEWLAGCLHLSDPGGNALQVVDPDADHSGG